MTINSKGKLLDLSTPIVMGVLNITPDSFYEHSRIQTVDQLLNQAERMISEGAQILDIGGMSSRPDAKIISEEVEIQRVLPAVRAVTRRFPEVVVSVDTFRSAVVRACFGEGAGIVNDISAGSLDDKLFETVAELGLPYILMHMKGIPETMQAQAQYTDVALEILDFLIKKVGILRGMSIKDIIVDVGFGFGKTVEQNFELLRKLSVFKILECPLLVGISRKSMIWKALDISPTESLNGTSIAHVYALAGGAKILRVHDVREAIEAIKIFERMKPTPNLI
jgi:dihydropteroate synthase